MDGLKYKRIIVLAILGVLMAPFGAQAASAGRMPKKSVAQTAAVEKIPIQATVDLSGRWRVNVSAGWTGMKVGIVKKSLNSVLMLDEYVWDMCVDGSTIPFTGDTQNASGAFCVTGEVDYRVGSIWGLGIRGSRTEEANHTATATARGAAGDYLDIDVKIDCSLQTLGVGGWVEGGRKIKGRGFLFVGPAFGKLAADESVSWYFTDPDYAIINMYTGVEVNPYKNQVVFNETGSCLAVEFGGDASMALTKHLAFVGSVSYRMSSINNMKFDRDVDVDGNGTADFHEGDADRNLTSGAKAKYDFGGINIQGGLRFSI